MKFFLTTAFTLLLLTSNIFAWSPRGHMLVAQIAYDNLSHQQKKIVTQYANQIYSLLPKQVQHELKRYKSKNHFVLIAALPDLWRDKTVQNIFQSFNTKLPARLKPYAQDTTNHWHYIDYPINNDQCSLPKSKTIVFAINTFKKAWLDQNNQNSKALIMVFLEHFIGDEYQPLHNFSYYNHACKNDLGGNNFNVYVGNRTMSLHSLWDKGVGFLFHHFNFENKAKRLQHEFPKSEFKLQLSQTNLLDQLQFNLKYAHFVYSIAPEKHIPHWYYRKGQKIARRQITLSGYQLAKTLKIQ